MTRTARQTRPAGAAEQISQGAHRAALHAGPWIERLARLGYAAKGVVYVLVGGLALLAAFTSRGQVTGSKGALGSLLDQPFGQILLGVVAFGLAGYALWCFVRAVLDPERDGRGAKGIGKRAFQFAKGLVHASLVLAVIGMIRGTGSGGGEGDKVDDWTAKLMSVPFGKWLVAGAGLGVIAYGAVQLYRAWTTDLDDQLALGRMSPGAHRWAIRASRAGMAARGVVFAVIGVFLGLAALHANPQEAKGVGEALQTLQRQPYGPWILGTVALGLMCYGVYEFIRAKYRRIEAA